MSLPQGPADNTPDDKINLSRAVAEGRALGSSMLAAVHLREQWAPCRGGSDALRASSIERAACTQQDH